MRLILAFLVIVHVHTTAYAAKYNLAAGEMNASLFQSSWILNGKVIDEKNEPIEGVSVLNPFIVIALQKMKPNGL